ncbi:cytochrome P450 family protein [Pseudarthrobacter siccitolerans]|uniref:Cytochrome P450 family protein n=1 Tax=Pseudarthrobacter siccitolerans TaxID=861266 RepID=A0A024GXW9_9MICC|nr:cytochrome P450 [Pseudarthrobacter siccitolerans]CCQ44603.1 cytochrome P450 family protein [Pseudarthrobacter siccitolerans]
MPRRTGLPKATASESAAFLFDVFLPTVAKGPIIRRPKMEAGAERLGLDDRAARRMAKLAGKYRKGPLLLRIPGRPQAVVLQPDHLHYVLANSPEPFSPASSEKKAALAHFEPRFVLISEGRERTARRALQEQVLDTHSPVHRLAATFLPIVQEEAGQLLQGIKDGRPEGSSELGWDNFIQSWYRVVRRTVFGDQARDDHELTNMLASLRKNANWSFLKPKDTGLRTRFLTRLTDRLKHAEPGSLGFSMAKMHPGQEAAPVDQVPQWLFAFEPAGMATFRTLALLATHPGHIARAREEVQQDATEYQHLPFLRACVLESLRLWPTTPMILRQTTREVQWPDGDMPAGCGVLIYAPYFHRDEANVPQAHSFKPERWLDRDGNEDWPLVPFSEGPVVCPGRQLVLMLTSAMLASLIGETTFTLSSSHALSPGTRLPGALNNFSLSFTVAGKQPHPSPEPSA